MADAVSSSKPDVRKTDDGSGSALPLGSAAEAGALTEAQPRKAPEGRKEVVEPGRALALADFAPPSLGAGERLIRLAYKVGLPASMLTSPIGKSQKTRLLATVESPLPGSKAAGTALRAGHFFLHGARTPIAQIDFGGAARLAPPVERLVHSFAWLGDLAAAAPRQQAAPIAERILAAWLDANAKVPYRSVKGPAWSVGNTGWRLLNWLANAPLILSGSDRKLRSRILGSINETARWLDRNVTRANDVLAETAGWAAIVAAGLLLPDGKPRRLYGEAGLIRALGELVGSDGGVLSRSPLGQMEAIALLIQLRACYRAVRREPPEAVENMLALLVPPLLALTHGDGSLGSWQGGWAIDAAEIAGLINASGVRTRPLRDVRQWGYQRVIAGKSVLQFDAAPPPMAREARHGCASTLAFEFSFEGYRIVVNCGGSAAAGGLIPVRLEQGLRATAAHSTLALDDANSTAVLINGKIGGGVGEVEVERQTLDGEKNGGATRIEASHDGYAARYGLSHRRILILRDDGTELRGEDLLVPAKGKGKRAKVGYAMRFHLGPDIDAVLNSDRQGASFSLPNGSYWQFRFGGGGTVSIEESLWADGQGRPQPIQQIVVHGMADRGGGTFGWVLKKMA